MEENNTKNKNHLVSYDYTNIDIKPLQVNFDKKH